MMQTSFYTQGNYTLSDLYNTFEVFRTEFNDTVFKNCIDEAHLQILYYLLYAKYGNAEIAGTDTNMWKYRLFSTIYQYAPSYFRKRDIQDAIIKLDLNDDEILKGTKAIYNTAQNPSTTPTTGSLEELEYINIQNTTNYKRSKIDAFSNLYSLISKDLLSELLDKFTRLFKTVLSPYKPVLYESEYGD